MVKILASLSSSILISNQRKYLQLLPLCIIAWIIGHVVLKLSEKMVKIQVKMITKCIIQNHSYTLYFSCSWTFWKAHVIHFKTLVESFLKTFKEMGEKDP